MPTCPALVVLLLAASALPARGSPAEPACLHFSELLPAKLRELRTKFEEIKDYFVSISLLVCPPSCFAFFAKFSDLDEEEDGFLPAETIWLCVVLWADGGEQEKCSFISC